MPINMFKLSVSSSFSKWPNDLMDAVEKHCWLLVQGRKERLVHGKMTKDYFWISAQKNIGMFSKL